ncbi:MULTISPECIES: CocE/NonD family hydrolase [Paenibacillus]|uniref:CocE/NonD family hydrolase n=1 Tax=Paenibacillus TaxID=44249 RepID=UPI00096CE0F1|nr:CocE/NonD family hydrolase [Paenibacillus odorifer]OMD79749.1 acyl esterase [Paenibacillus odorifer]
MNKFFTKKEMFQGEELESIYRVARRPVDKEQDIDLSASENPMDAMGQGFCPPFNQRTYIAGEGVICQQDVPVKMRDGVTIYCDIYMPENRIDKIPALVSWSFFGKRPGEGMSEWQIMGVPPQTVSKLAKFESPDPMYWCRMGYAVANVDTRGAGHSEGDVSMFSRQDCEDGYDFIEWLGVQYWCNGRVGMGGNSGVAMTQYRVAAYQPPHLACIAPWEGTTDVYREAIYEGGIPALSFNEFIAASVTGNGGVDDQVAMARKYPLMNGYWRDKIPDFSKITIPCYCTAGWSHFHLRGSIQGYRKIKTKQKWLRVHRDFEWADAYDPYNLEDLKRFYDRYLKDIHNGWELTPRVRLDVMDAFDCDYQVQRKEKGFPLERTQYTRYYLDAASMSMQEGPVSAASEATYDSDSGEAIFDMEIKEDTELTGYMFLRLYVEAAGHDDMDLFINIQKADGEGNWIPWHVLDEPHPGAWGKIRVSHRELDSKLSTHYQPVLSHERELKLTGGEVVPVDIEIVPSSRIWHKGEKLRVQVAGRYIREGWFEPLAWDTDNKGRHIIRTGGEYQSFLQVPVIPPRYQSGEYIYR